MCENYKTISKTSEDNKPIRNAIGPQFDVD